MISRDDQLGIAAARSGNSGLGQQVVRAVKAAAQRTGVSFEYLMKKAVIESGANPEAQSRTSSAAGLFQFTSQTWLRTIKNHGAEYGLGECAAQIQIGRDGSLWVSDPVARQEILDLRKDPEISAEMAGELDKDNSLILQRSTGESAGPTELYLAHFLGASGASTFLNTLRANPNAAAADVLPRAASANAAVFYAADGQPRTVGEIYSQLAQRFDQAPEDVMGNVRAVYGSGPALSASAHMGSGRASLEARLAVEQMQLDSIAATIADDESVEESTLSLMV